jgi:hypothetical protein
MRASHTATVASPADAYVDRGRVECVAGDVTASTAAAVATASILGMHGFHVPIAMASHFRGQPLLQGWQLLHSSIADNLIVGYNLPTNHLSHQLG